MADHGHGHEKAGGHGGQSEWMKHAMNGIRALLVGVAVASFAPPLLACSGILVSNSVASAMGGFAGGVTLANSSGGTEKKGGGGHHH